MLTIFTAATQIVASTASDNISVVAEALSKLRKQSLVQNVLIASMRSDFKYVDDTAHGIDEFGKANLIDIERHVTTRLSEGSGAGDDSRRNPASACAESLP
jgi:hypothetical protein